MSLIKRTRDSWLPSVFDDMFNSDWFDNVPTLNRIGTSVPAVNIKEKEDSYVVEVAAPGMTRDDFKLELHNDVLTISSEKRSEDETKDEKGAFTRREFSYSSFRRSFSLPKTVDTAKIAANYKDGVLAIDLPKHEEAKDQSRRMIEIS